MICSLHYYYWQHLKTRRVQKALLWWSPCSQHGINIHVAHSFCLTIIAQFLLSLSPFTHSSYELPVFSSSPCVFRECKHIFVQTKYYHDNLQSHVMTCPENTGIHLFTIWGKFYICLESWNFQKGKILLLCLVITKRY